MAEDVVPETVLRKNVCSEICVIVSPVVRKFFWAKNQDVPVSKLVVFHDRESCESLAEPNAISEDAPIVGFQFVNDTYRSVFLVVEELFPNQTILVSGLVIRQDILVHLREEV